jgi:hypothetical protein
MRAAILTVVAFCLLLVTPVWAGLDSFVVQQL